MDLICWVLLLFDSLTMRQPRTENPDIRLGKPLALQWQCPPELVAADNRAGGRLL